MARPDFYSLTKKISGAFDWEEGLSAARIQKALQGFTADALPQGYYRISKRTDPFVPLPLYVYPNSY